MVVGETIYHILHLVQSELVGKHSILQSSLHFHLCRCHPLYMVCLEVLVELKRTV